jgi:hypothetical protein
MRRLATITMSALVLGVAPLSAATAAEAAAPAAVTPAAAQTGQWVNTGETYPLQWICVYAGNQKVTSGQAVNFSCPAGPAGSYALWILTP